MSADRNLLFGILAVQLDFVSRDALIDAMNAWLLDKAKPLGDVLRDQGRLSPARLQLLDALVAEHLKQHGDDPKRSLAALSSVDSALRQSLAAVTDAEVQHSLAQLTVPPREAPGGNTGTPVYVSVAGGADPPAAAGSGVRYRVLRPHKKGGLGEVFVAEDTELGRHVALKEIQDRYADDGASRTRFVLEAEITGGLEHPGIVPVYGLGTYSDGRPFYAMRFIKGDNLLDAIRRFHGPASVEPSGLRETDGASEHVGLTPRRSPDFGSLEFRDLLRRFIDVCNAVAYAHSRGVLHRDLKPGNVMLGKYGETLVVDWGLAKALGRSDPSAGGDSTLLPRSGKDSSAATVAGQALGTPAYMSPEQADGRLDELGPATDVYSLGATLYEVLAGRTAFHGQQVMDVLVRVVAGEVPPPRSAQPAVPAALEAVCQKAMALKPADRYPSAQALARDVERWLADEPVSAYPEPLGARMRRWVRRHARLVTSLAAALAVGLVAVGVVAWQREQARRALDDERTKAVEAAVAERAANETAQKRLTQLERANEILGSVFKDLDPKQTEKEGKPLQAVLGERLDRATAVIEGEAIGDALAVARMQMMLGESQLGLGYPEKAIPLFTAARTTFTAQYGPDHADTLVSMNYLAHACQAAGKLDVALPLLEEAFRLSKAKLGTDHLDTLGSMAYLAEGYREAGQLDRALPLLEETLALKKAKLGPDHNGTLRSMNNLALGYEAAGQLDRAVLLLEETLALVKAKLGPDHPDTLTGMSNLAGAYRSAGRLDRALPLFEETLELRTAKLGPDHPDTLISKNDLGMGYIGAGRLDRALPLFEETLKLRTAKLGPDHPDTLHSMGNLASGYHTAGQLDRALPLFEETLKLKEAKLGPDHPSTLTGLNNLAEAYRDAGRFDQALPLYEKALKLMKAKLGPDHPYTLGSMNNLALGYNAAGQLDRALPLFEETLTLVKAKLGPDHPYTFQSMGNLAGAYRSSGRLERALTLLEEALTRRKAKLGPDHPDTLNSMNGLALGYRDAGRLDRALTLLEEALDLRKAKLGPDHPDTLVSLNNLAGGYQAAGRLGDALPLFEEAARGIEHRLYRHEHAGRIVANTADCLEDLRRFDTAETWRRKWLAVVKERSGPQSPAYASGLAGLGLNLLRQQKWADAEPTLRTCLAIRAKAEPDTWTTFNTQSLLGDSLLGQQKLADAEPLLLAGYDGLKQRAAKIPNADKLRLPEAAERLVRLYDALGKPDESAKYLDEMWAWADVPAAAKP